MMFARILPSLWKTKEMKFYFLIFVIYIAKVGTQVTYEGKYNTSICRDYEKVIEHHGKMLKNKIKDVIIHKHWFACDSFLLIY